MGLGKKFEERKKEKVSNSVKHSGIIRNTESTF
jgi:hypothetical protein